ncbi:SAM-dependent methyltransferase [Streptomyces sp. WAC01526]|uniref:SAM-dependent methyltransferase n=1 Tax=Streptomyces sp. WAC01526 TaxID=2588709 RepID=UPI0011DEFF64|nr:SAM-dependent methyltransferase [Streptomyces sp. WAC01526]
MAPRENPQARPLDMETPSVARMYDYLLGGSENFQPDREACTRLLQIAPSTQQLARNNRAFLQRIVRILVRDFGITQFLDHGSGLPTQDNVHEIAQRIKPEAKVAYIDNDPMVLAHGRTTLRKNSNVMIIDQDMRNTEEILEATKDFFNWDKPIAALFVSVLHCLPDTDDDRDPAALIKRVAAALPSKSYMVICQLVSDSPIIRDGVTALMAEVTQQNWGRVRETHEVRKYFDGMEVLPPDLVEVVDWRPDTPPPPQHLRATDWIEWGGVGRT